MNATEQINQWIEEHGSARDALNVALARLDAAKEQLAAFLEERQLFVELFDAVDDMLCVPGEGYPGAINENHVEALIAQFIKVSKSKAPDILAYRALLTGEEKAE